MTIEPVPTGGTLEGVDIICGTKGSICSANHPDGVLVELHPTADPGFTFMGFIGDCVPLGHTQMTVPRTCSATFSPTAEVSAPPPIKAVATAPLAHADADWRSGAAAPRCRPRAAPHMAPAMAVPIRPQAVVDPSTAGAEKPARRRRPTRSSRKARFRNT